MGNVVSGNEQGGISIRGVASQGIVVEENEVGTDITGTQPLGNQYSGVLVGDWGVTGDGPSDVTIGGTTTGAGNVISDNGNFGVWISGASVSGAVVEGDFIGTDRTGTVALGNSEEGVEIDSGAVDNTIGGLTAAVSNVIAGNGTGSTSQSPDPNLAILGSGTSGNLVEGNFIGTNSAGTTGLNPAESFGVGIGGGASDNSVGGTAAGAGNVISGNATYGLLIEGQGTRGTWWKGMISALTRAARMRSPTDTRACSSAGRRATPSAARRPGRERIAGTGR